MITSVEERCWSMSGKYLLALASSAVFLAGCGGGDEGANSASFSGVEFTNLVKKTNFSQGFPGLYSDYLYGKTLDQNGTVRFDTSSQIPLYYVSATGANPPAEITKAVDHIESRLGDIFTDFQLLTEDLSVYRDTAYPNENRGNSLYSEASFKNNHGIIGGLVIAKGSAFYSSEWASNPQEMCGNASIGPYTGSMSLVVNPDTHTYSSDSLLWVNMGNGQCSWDSQMTTHEMAHSMGMFAHLEGYFGLWSEVAMDILATLYSNPAGTSFSELQRAG